MTERSLTILSCGSAKPTESQTPSSQLLRLRDKEYMIDCGEGAQLHMAHLHILPPHRLGHIFISHLHGDHCLGLIGFLSTLGMMDRTSTLYIHAPSPAKRLFQPMVDFFCAGNGFDIVIEEIDTRHHVLVYEDNTVSVSTIPLKHSVPTCGYLFEEKPTLRHYLREVGDAYGISTAYIPGIKAGADYTMPDGTVIPNSKLTTDPKPPFRYAYCSDTAYYEKIIPIIEEVDCLYHEATYISADIEKARKHNHSTAVQAAEIAKLARVKELIIGHFSSRYKDIKPILDEARAVFSNTRLAMAETKIEF